MQSVSFAICFFNFCILFVCVAFCFLLIVVFLHVVYFAFCICCMWCGLHVVYFACDIFCKYDVLHVVYFACVCFVLVSPKRRERREKVDCNLKTGTLCLRYGKYSVGDLICIILFTIQKKYQISNTPYLLLIRCNRKYILHTTQPK